MKVNYYFLQIIFLLLIIDSLFAQEKQDKIIDPMKFLPTLSFEEGGFLKTSEKNFPISINFNISQDSNNDGSINVEDNIENSLVYQIGINLKGTGRTGLPDRGPNNQSPAVYFNHEYTFRYEVYQYWYYYAENSHLENHEHDWESVFIFVKDSMPTFVQLTSFGKLVNIKWKDFKLDDGHIVLGVRRGDHSFVKKPKDGVVIRFNGEIFAQKGKLYKGHGQVIPWLIFSSDLENLNTIYFNESKVTKFYYGDIAYPRSGKEMDLPRKAPWKRRRWRSPRKFDT